MPARNPIPFLDLVALHHELEPEFMAVFQRALQSASFIGGPMVENFENAFAHFCETKHAVGVGSGTDALRFALVAAGVAPGDVVVTVPHTFIATTEAISQAGALPEFVDINEQTYNMSPDQLSRYFDSECYRDASGTLLSRRSGRPVTAIVPVHIYGQMADMDAILEIADQHHLAVIEDACQAHGAEYFSKKHNRWFKAGSMGKAAAFSFYPGKNLGACGEAGAVTTSDPEVANTVRLLRDHGQRVKYFHSKEGYNGRLDAIQAGLLEIKLKHLSEWNTLRRQHAAEYNRLLAPNDFVICPYESPESRAVYHLYVIRTQERDQLVASLKTHGVGTGIHYPVPLHVQSAYSWMGYRPDDFSVTSRVANEIISLPMFPQLTLEQQTYVAEKIAAYTTPLSSRRSVGNERPEDLAAVHAQQTYAGAGTAGSVASKRSRTA